MSILDVFRRNKWRPIESAPRDGTPLLLSWYEKDWDDVKNREYGYWVIVTGQFGSFSIFGHDGDYWCDNGTTQCTLRQKPTYWKYPPSPPRTR